MHLTTQTIADHAIPLVQRALVAQLRGAVQGATRNQKIGVVQVLIYRASRQVGLPYTLLVPKKGFDEKIKKAFAIAEYLSVETLLDLAIEILEEPIDQNG
jgi:hypothetical protein